MALLVAALLFFLLRGDGDQAGEPTAGTGGVGTPTGNGDTGPTSSPATGSTPTTGAPGPAATAPAGGAVTANSEPLLPLPDQGLGQYAGTAAQGQSVQVQSVVADEGFWVGPSEEQRLYVRVQVEGESAPQVEEGQTVSFRGTAAANPDGFAEQQGVDAAEGAGQLEQQGYHIEATELQVDSSGGG